MVTDEQISIMCDIVKSGGGDLPPAKLAALPAIIPAIIAGGLVERTAGDNASVEKYKLTCKGQKLLDDRGVGANES
jgi:hypothetical protein